jgi:23S rRNA pseudouridine1911/1915/1917 synthase
MQFIFLKPDQDDCGARLDQLISKKFEIKRELIKKNLEDSELFLLEDSDACYSEDFSSEDVKRFKTKKIRLSHRIAGGDSFFIPKFELKDNEVLPVIKDYSKFDFESMILFEDNDLIIINKVPGLITHQKPGDQHDEVTLVDLTKNYLSKNGVNDVGEEGREFIVHRLDRDTAGLMILAKNEVSHASFSQMFKERKIIKRYRGLVCGNPGISCGVINEFIGRDKTNRMKRFVPVKKNLKYYPDAKEAVTHFFVKSSFLKNKISLVEFILETGRTHQIRAHMEFMGCPILGDKIYGVDKNKNIVKQVLKNEIQYQMLQSFYLEFDHPATNQRMKFEIPMRFDMENLIKSFDIS